MAHTPHGESETEATFDPFAPQEGGNKTKFGKLKLFANPVTLESGASYQIKGIHDREGNTRDWKGKRLDKTSKRFHVVMHVRADDKDGNEYEMAKDYLNSDKPYKTIVYPALAKVFGEKQFPTKDYAFVQLEELPTGETYVATGGDKAGQTVEKTAWKVVNKFANEGALKAAEKEYFSRFTTGANGATPESGVITFGVDLVKTFRRHAKKGAEVIYNDFIDGVDEFEAMIAQHGKEAVIAEVKKLIA